MDNFCTIYIARHGETVWNADHLVAGSKDVALNETGEKQAKELAQKFNTIDFEKIISSDLIRARRTAEIIGLEKRLAVETTKILRERRFGRFEGGPSSNLREIDAILEKLSKAEIAQYKHEPDIESDAELMDRLIPFIKETAVAYPGKNILLVTHGSMMIALLRELGYIKVLEKKIKNTAYITLSCDGIDIALKGVEGIYDNTN